jgi:uncharacterized protein (UPF0333 family)
MKNHNFPYCCSFPDLLNSIEALLSEKFMNIITLYVAISLVAIIVVVVGGSMIITPPINAQENLTSFAQSQNATATTTNTTTGAAEEKTYILVFGQRTVGNIDNSTKIVSSIVGNNTLKIQEEFLEEISLAPSQQLEEQINTIVNDGINGSPCGEVSLTTQQGENVSVDCISSENAVIWYIHPTS